MITPLKVKENQSFIGRSFELKKLAQTTHTQEANIVVVYGRRRVGKTALIEHAYKNHNILKFEGIEGLGKKQQLQNALQQLAVYTQDPMSATQPLNSWKDFFILLAQHTQSGTWTIYLEELQWLANYKGTIISELKYVWDNYFRHNPKLIIVLCGSAPSFMIDEVLHSRALYNRSQYEIHLKEFNLHEATEFFKHRSHKEVLDACLTVGGIPEYLKWVNKDSSIFLSLCQNAFTANSFFASEYQRIFTSSLAKNKYYKTIIEFLSKRKYASREEIIKHLGLSSGGGLSKLLLDLEKSEFIIKYAPYNLNEDGKRVRYAISDQYLQFYFKFIKPIKNKVNQGDYNNNPRIAIKTDSYDKWLGFAFERWCRRYHSIIAKILGFSAIQYQSGAYFNQVTEPGDIGFQLDLVFDRSDNVITLCEIKYNKNKLGKSVIEEFEKKLALFPNKHNKTLHKVLICTGGIDNTLEQAAYFDQVITLEQLFEPVFWKM